jgi:hypothetical protein
MSNQFHLLVETLEPNLSLRFLERCGITAEDIKVRSQ